MKYICLGYFDEQDWETKSEKEQNDFMDRCFAYDELLREKGHVAGGEALQSPRNAVTIRYDKGKLSVTDGPFVETKEQIGGILILEAKDLNEAIRLISNHPGAKIGPFEIRAVEDMSGIIEESKRRRASK